MKNLIKKYWYVITISGLVSSFVMHHTKTIEFSKNEFVVINATKSNFTVFDGTAKLEIDGLRSDYPFTAGDTTYLKYIGIQKVNCYYVKMVSKIDNGYIAELQPVYLSFDGKSLCLENPWHQKIKVFTEKKDEFLVTQSYIFAKK